MNGANGSGTGGYGSGAGAYGAGTGVSGAGSGTDSGASGTGTGSYGGEGVPYVGGGIAGGGAGVAQMTIQGPSQVKVGDSVTVALTMQADQPLTSASTTLSYDTTKLQFTGVTEGDFMKQGGDTTSFSDRVVQGGQLILADSVVGGTGASAQGTFAVLTFKALAAVSQTSIQAQPGTIIGASGQQFTMTPPQAYSLGVATMQ
jgi:general secretion pathway protein D